MLARGAPITVNQINKWTAHHTHGGASWLRQSVDFFFFFKNKLFVFRRTVELFHCRGKGGVLWFGFGFVLLSSRKGWMWGVEGEAWRRTQGCGLAFLVLRTRVGFLGAPWGQHCGPRLHPPASAWSSPDPAVLRPLGPHRCPHSAGGKRAPQSPCVHFIFILFLDF